MLKSIKCFEREHILFSHQYAVASYGRGKSVESKRIKDDDGEQSNVENLVKNMCRVQLHWLKTKFHCFRCRRAQSRRFNWIRCKFMSQTFFPLSFIRITATTAKCLFEFNFICVPSRYNFLWFCSVQRRRLSTFQLCMPLSIPFLCWHTAHATRHMRQHARIMSVSNTQTHLAKPKLLFIKHFMHKINNSISFRRAALDNMKGSEREETVKDDRWR